MDNINKTEPPFLPAHAVREDKTSKDDGNSSNLVWLLPVVFVLCASIFVCFVFVYKRRHRTATRTSEHPEKKDTVLVEGVELGSLTLVASDSGEGQNISSRKPRLLDPEETWRNAKFLFPGLLNDITLRDVEGKYMTRKYFRLENLNVAIQEEMHDRLDSKVLALSKEKDWESLNETRNAANLCIAVGMNRDAVKLRFQLIENLKKELTFLHLDKSHILNTIKHVIDTIHVNNVNNPFGDGNDMNGQIHGPNYHGKPWLSYLGVNWHRHQIKEKTEEVESKLKQHIPSRKGFFVHGTNAEDLIKIAENDGELNDSKGYHDFGPGVYCFKNELKWALSFAVDRCFPVQQDEEGNAVIKSCNPAAIVFPEHDHTIFKNKIPQKALHVRGKPMGSKEVKGLDHFCRDRKAKYDEFMDCRKQWKNDKELGYWKDFVKLSKIYGRLPPKARKGDYLVYHGPMHSANEADTPIGDKVPVVDEDGWTQYCFRYRGEALVKKMIFVEFNIDWTELLKTDEDGMAREDYKETMKQLDEAKEGIEEKLG